jgi:hypothetical protein
MRRRRSIGLVVAMAVVVASILTPTFAWAIYRANGTAEANVFSTHVLLAPGRPTCSGLGILAVTLSWTPPSDASFVLSYELGKGTSSGGPYTYTNVGTATSNNPSISNGNQYFVVRTVNQQWRGTPSAERRVNSFLNLTVTCP